MKIFVFLSFILSVTLLSQSDELVDKFKTKATVSEDKMGLYPAKKRNLNSLKEKDDKEAEARKYEEEKKQKYIEEQKSLNNATVTTGSTGGSVDTMGNQINTGSSAGQGGGYDSSAGSGGGMNNNYNSGSSNNGSTGMIRNDQGNYEYDPSKTVTTKTADGEVITIPIVTHLKELNSNAKINLDFYDAEITAVIKYISDITSTNFIIPQIANFKGKKITIMSPKKVKAVDALNAFFTVLNANNYSIVKSGSFYQIVPIQDANKPNFIYYQNEKVPNVDYFVTKIYNLKYALPRDIEMLINKIRSRNGIVATYEPNSLIIYTDTGYMVNKVFEIIKKVDIPSETAGKIWMIPIYYADAKDLATKLDEIFDLKKNQNQTQKTNQQQNIKVNDSQKIADTNSGDNAGSEESDAKLQIQKIIADERTNQLIVICDEDSKSKLIDLIKKLDIPLENDSTVHVYYLKNAKAEEIATTINALSSNTQTRNTNTRGGKNTNTTTANTGNSGGIMFQGEVKVTADKATNTLVTTASSRDYNALRKVIDLLDLKRRQVYVEAVIMEISMDKTRDVGVSMSGGTKSEVQGETVPMYAGTSLGDLSTLAINPTALSGFAFGALGPSVELTDDISIPSFGVILKALQTNSDVNVLSSPHVLTMDNEEAEFIVGENVPFPSGITSSYASVSSYVPVVSIQRQDVAIKLTIKPQISGDNQVKLDVKQEITEVKSVDKTMGPTTSKRSVKTIVVVPDQQTIVIGGLMKDNISETVNKVPILGDIPVLGYAFKYSSKRVSKSNLMIFLTPYIIRNPKDMDKIWKKKMEEFEEFKRLKDRASRGFDIYVDYDKKTGLFSEINKEVEKFETQINTDKKLNTKDELKYDVDLKTQREEKSKKDTNTYIIPENSKDDSTFYDSKNSENLKTTENNSETGNSTGSNTENIKTSDSVSETNGSDGDAEWKKKSDKYL